MSMPPPSRTPTRPIRPDGEIPNSQDDDEGHSSDFEDLLEEPTESCSLTSKSTSPPASSPLPAPAVHAATSSVQKPAVYKPATTTTLHGSTYLPLTTLPISSTINTHPPATQPSTSPPSATAAATSPPNPQHTRLQTQIPPSNPR